MPNKIKPSIIISFDSEPVLTVTLSHTGIESPYRIPPWLHYSSYQFWIPYG